MAQVSQESIRNELLASLEAAAPEHEIDIVDVEVVGSAKAPTIRVRIDHLEGVEEPISLDEVSAHTQWISDLVDDADPIESSFTLEVSSPGLARPLRKFHDFERFAGETVRLTTTATEGRRKFTGTLLGVDDEQNIRLECDGETHSIAFSEIKNCKIKPSF